MNKSLKSMLEVATIVALGLGVSGLGMHLSKSYFKPKDLEEKEWILYNNPDGRIWDEYMNESTPHTNPNWRLYQEEVRKRNPQGLTGEIYLPDLDGDGKVGDISTEFTTSFYYKNF